ncbi:MAG TPA: aspartate ammonia-lyase [Candidatus Omnitrophica bacterium]|nr:MAG: aspartate ammonia-lyase [Omnitrophica WOR_2 bacterium GWA2_63_20]OGX17180.1 MAG: aspartate ammonia-lyase [Omnitrophica WOR_2 bacterium GWF2_63_9]OGX31355.1 MAG: aspartate ammonia-lyase [Omnitrophica WOR_2 bacterium RIFCSPHIGHO2_12_FULL_64_13]OGX34679.1 MAG: aspartate ammonia-lyase [Omnitrophica WOR_2 bacterium RIFCSPHIGHO2_02_FULL_63_39]OGX44646.1 MAG: aspartate ammonia-lyase [Omnitrophica WOR_2 bacterium RIFCSPLOWO2_02_FULL_63_16]OGX49216.1 MAG: aspartate ammonia-lyase [Omnitrophica W
MATRLERDSLGTRRIPSRAYYGIQTHRAVENFPISGLRLHQGMVRAMALIKKAAAHANVAVGCLPRRFGSAIARACDEVLRGRFDDQFVVDVYQAGAGTSFNMNVNEVIANRANELLGARRGTYRFLHPNDHVNMAQSTNDTIPTAIRLACLMAQPALVDSMARLEAVLSRKARQFGGIVKSGRTHLQDAVPVRLGREFGAYAVAVRKAREAVACSAEALQELNLGGTAVGTGMNAHPRYRRLALQALRRWTQLPVHSAEDLMERMQSAADFARFSGALRAYALELIRIANDLRLLSSGPNTGLGEIELPTVQPGSSIMPGKVNPVVAEMVDMVGFQVLGHDATVAYAVQAGQLELNVMMPVIAYNLLQAMALLTTATHVFATRCVSGIRANAQRCGAYAKRSLALVTALNPHLGYLNAAKVAKESLASGRSIQDLVVARGWLSPASARRLLDPYRLSR